jgi:uncharacterized membrane protein YhhN
MYWHEYILSTHLIYYLSRMHRPLHILFRLYWLVVIAELLLIFFNKSEYRLLTKPLLMLTLMAAYFYQTRSDGAPYKRFVITGLFFSLCGDILLLFQQQYASLFIPGLVSFLLTHLLYIFYFMKIQPLQNGLLRKQPYWILLPLAYGGAFFWFLLPHLGAMLIPVALYTLVICTMLLTAINTRARIPAAVYRSFVAGAVFFILSDSLLAIRLFYQPFPYSDLLVMATYCLAQYLIATASVRHLDDVAYKSLYA